MHVNASSFAFVCDEVKVPIPVAAPSKAVDYCRSIAGISGSNSTGGVDVFLECLLCVVK
jgi:hypothetical protein